MYISGCNNEGGGENFSKVKQLVANWTGTQKRLFSVFSKQTNKQTRMAHL